MVKPEVSTLDFANGAVIEGFEVPSLRTRRAETEVELREGQFLAVAGLLDNESTRNMTKIPILGDIPILGELFKSRGMRQRRTELVVLVSPQLVMASDQAPPLPTGEPGPSEGRGNLEVGQLSRAGSGRRIHCSRELPLLSLSSELDRRNYAQRRS